MKNISLKIGLVCTVLMAWALGAESIAGALLITNNSVPVKEISPAALNDIYTGKTKYWSDGQPVIIVVLPDLTDAALKDVSGMNASEFKTFWQRMVFSGRGQLPKKADDAAALVALVASTKGAIALVPEKTGLKDVKILEVK